MNLWPLPLKVTETFNTLSRRLLLEHNEENVTERTVDQPPVLLNATLPEFYGKALKDYGNNDNNVDANDDDDTTKSEKQLVING